MMMFLFLFFSKRKGNMKKSIKHEIEYIENKINKEIESCNHYEHSRPMFNYFNLGTRRIAFLIEELKFDNDERAEQFENNFKIVFNLLADKLKKKANELNGNR